MDIAFLSSAIGQLIHLFGWSTLVTLAVLSYVRFNPNVQYWSAFWKVALSLSLLPLVPWAQLELSVVDFPVAYQFVSEIPAIWSEGAALSHSPDNYSSADAGQKTFFHLMSLTALFVMLTSLLKTGIFTYQLVKFNRSINRYQALHRDDTKLAFLSEQQKIFLQEQGIRILLSNSSTSPFAIGLMRTSIVLPSCFFTLPANQQTLLMEHEISHIKRHDLIWIMLSQLASCLFWFTPAAHLIKSRMALAIEVECDRQVLDVYPTKRKEYGNALLNVVRRTQQSVNPQAAFFINHQFSDLKSRIQFTQIPIAQQGEKLMSKVTLLVTAVLFSATSWAVNTTVQNPLNVDDFKALHQHASRLIEEHSSPVELLGTWVNPVQTSWVSSKFKARQKIRDYKPHLGIDLAAEMGDPIVAASDGVVIIADNTSLHKNHGNVVIIDHGDGALSMYSHMGSFDVKPGDVVQAGQLLGKVGVTGKSSGPHLHFEVIAADRHIDPATLIAFTYR